MLSFSKPAAGVRTSATSSGRPFVAVPTLSRQPVRNVALVPRPALLLDQPLGQDDSRRSKNVLSEMFNMVVHWLEPQEQSHVGEEQLLAELAASMDHDDGHGGWVHSHIADRLATEPSSRMSQMSEDL